MTWIQAAHSPDRTRFQLLRTLRSYSGWNLETFIVVRFLELPFIEGFRFVLERLGDGDV